jgi:hypothetical protein
MTGKTPRSLEEAASEVERELHVRERCYDRWIADGKLTRVDAQDRYDRLLSALDFLQAKKLGEEQANGEQPLDKAA